MKKSCLLYDSWGELFIKLPDDTAGKLIKVISAYCFKGEVSTDDPVVDAMFGMIKMKLDEDAQAYEEVKVQRSEAAKKRWSGCKAMQKDANACKDMQMDTEACESMQTDAVSESDSVSVSDKDIKEKDKKKKFVKPSPEEVKAYCEERKNSVDPEAFIDFYESKGWRVGNQPMKDWKAAVRTWEKRDQKPTNKSSPRIHNHSLERKYDFAALETEVIGNG